MPGLLKLFRIPLSIISDLLERRNSMSAPNTKMVGHLPPAPMPPIPPTPNPGCCVYANGDLYLDSRTSGLVRSGPVRSGPVRSGPVRSGPVRSGPVRSGPVRSGPVRSGPVRSGPVRSGPVRSGPVRSGPVWAVVADLPNLRSTCGHRRA